MRYLSGAPYLPALTWEHGGVMFTPEMGNKRLRLNGVTWAADNGCFTAVQAAYDIGCESVDGTFIKYAPDQNWKRVQTWFDKLCRHEEVRYWGDDRRFGRCVKCGAEVWRMAETLEVSA